MKSLNKDWWAIKESINSKYQSCSICMNEMTLVKSSNGDYWICKVCNNMAPKF